MYETSTVKLRFESASFFNLTRSKSSMQVKGIIPLSGPSLKCPRNCQRVHQNSPENMRPTSHHTVAMASISGS
jgi:hypothetical protein